MHDLKKKTKDTDNKIKDAYRHIKKRSFFSKSNFEKYEPEFRDVV